MLIQAGNPDFQAAREFDTVLINHYSLAEPESNSRCA
jgi:hypothetical protein